MITYVEGDLFTSPAQTLVNTVNTAGVMGRGIAKTFKRVYPEMFSEYQRICEAQELRIGRLFLYETTHKWILNFPTKRHWRQPSRPEDIRAGLESFAAQYADHGIISVAFPQLGCGNGGLDWERQVRPLMEHYLAPLAINTYIHIYSEGSLMPEYLDQEQMTRWLRSEPRSLPFSEVWNELVDAISQDRASGWSIADGDQPGVRLDAINVRAELAYSDLFDLWRQFRRFGFLTPADVSIGMDIPPTKLLELLGTLPYVVEATVATVFESTNTDRIPTAILLGEPNARGIRFVHPLIDESDELSPVHQLIKDSSWLPSNPTLTQSALV